MEDRIPDFLSSCSRTDFGAVSLSEGEETFYRELNHEIISLCRSLPESTQTDATLFFMGYAAVSVGEDLNFFRNFYAPSWSIIYWLVQSRPEGTWVGQEDLKNARTAHSMAMLLHSFDDHINDSELPVSHLTLLLRSQAWMIMNNAFSGLADGVDGGARIVQGFINDYYSSICRSHAIQSLESYCDLFRRQMATWFIVPGLMTKRISSDVELTDDVLTAYGSFGIAWRLLDDIKDLETDLTKGAHSSVYFCLPAEIKREWNREAEQKRNASTELAKSILYHIVENRVVEGIQRRICSELDLAASIADRCDIPGLADEFRCLSKPLQNPAVLYEPEFKRESLFNCR